jgi:hypothetical protein
VKTNRTIRKILKIVEYIILFIGIPLLLFSQPGGGWNPSDSDPTVVPLGGGLIILVTLVTIYILIKVFRFHYPAKKDKR